MGAWSGSGSNLQQPPQAMQGYNPFLHQQEPIGKPRAKSELGRIGGPDKRETERTYTYGSSK